LAALPMKPALVAAERQLAEQPVLALWAASVLEL
jgi:hypothetical protein